MVNIDVSSSSSSSAADDEETCSICMGELIRGQGQAIFTAECSHSFHFNCISSRPRNVYGNEFCPVCNCIWNQKPFPRLFNPPVRPYQSIQPEPLHFSDDEPLLKTSAAPAQSPISSPQAVLIKGIPEFPAVSASLSLPTFAVLVGVQAPPLHEDATCLQRGQIDLVTVLDVSGSMQGSKIALLKQAACFIIQNLGPLDRLSIVSFASTARRIFPLTRMTDRGREDATRAINSLSANGGTNIVEGLKKGVRVLEERRERNPVSSVILLSDGQDTCHRHSQSFQRGSVHFSTPKQLGYLELLPPSICPTNGASEVPIIPVHAFGFGADHDAAALHAISNASGGTFSFIESLDMIQEAFARCIGGLLSVVAQQLRIRLKTGSPVVQIGSIDSGRYSSEIFTEGQQGEIHVGDLYADEEREFLVYLSVPLSSEAAEITSLLDLKCLYKDSVSKEMRCIKGPSVEIRRPEMLSSEDTVMSLAVDRQRNRLLVAQAIEEAQRMAEVANLHGARSVLEQRRSTLLSSPSAQAGDGLCVVLETELREIKERMASMNFYNQGGRAYAFGVRSSHASQRASTNRAVFAETHQSDLWGNMQAAGGFGAARASNGLFGSKAAVGGYDTPVMRGMVRKSQEQADQQQLNKSPHENTSTSTPRQEEPKGP